MFTVHTDTPERIDRALAALAGAATVSEAPVPRRPLVLERVSAG